MWGCALKPDAERQTGQDEALERRIVVAMQGGLPTLRHPYRQLARELGLSEQALLDTLQQMLDRGSIRRIGVVPNHYALGYKHNLMIVWDIDDTRVDSLGETIGELEFVSHCYRRPRKTDWPYNLFVMVHGRTVEEVEEKITQVRRLVGTAYRSHTSLVSTRILKKTGLRLRAEEK